MKVDIGTVLIEDSGIDVEVCIGTVLIEDSGIDIEVCIGTVFFEDSGIDIEVSGRDAYALIVEEESGKDGDTEAAIMHVGRLVFPTSLQPLIK